LVSGVYSASNVNSSSAESNVDRLPPVSVVIPAYNYGHYIGSSVRSVLAQDYPELEVIVVDDGSTDDTAQVVASLNDPRVRYVWQQNAGLSAARNTGVAAAKYDLIGFLDADDLWLPRFLRSVVKVFADRGDSFGLVATSTNRMDEHGTPLPSPRDPLAAGGELTVKEFCLRNRPYSSSIVVRRSVFDTVGGFDRSLRSSEDRDMWIRATAAGFRFYFIGEPLAVLRRHRVNMSKDAERMKANSRTVLVNAFRRNAVPRWNLHLWLRVFSIHFFQIALTHFDQGLQSRALRYLLSSWLIWPFFVRPAKVHETHLFRLRTFARFCRGMWVRRPVPNFASTMAS
jgi:glycosyltransferase involved in cell wall biosynthesis